MNDIQFLRYKIMKFSRFGLIFSLFFLWPLIVAQQTSLATLREKARQVAEQRVAEGKRKVKQVGAMKFGDAARLQKAREEQINKYLIRDKTKEEIEKQTTPDDFTQTEAHLQSSEVRKLISARPSSMFIPYLGIFAEALSREAELKDTHYVFYHGVDNVWRTPQDLYTQLYAYYHPEQEVKDFIFLRFAGENGPAVNDFLMQQLDEHGLVNDNIKANKSILLSVNLSMFGNIGFSGESTWNYFYKPKSHEEPWKEIFEGIMDTFNLSHDHINELMGLYKIYGKTKEQSLLQVFVPKEKVDDIAYLAWVLGIPAHKPTIDEIEKSIAGKARVGAVTAPAITRLAQTFKKEHEKNSLFKDMRDSVSKGAYKVSPFLKMYCNNPWSLENLNDVTARLIFTQDVLLNPVSGVKIYRYSTTDRDALAEYHKRLDAIVDKLITTKKVQTKGQ